MATFTTQSGKTFQGVVSKTGAIDFTFIDNCQYSGVVAVINETTFIRPNSYFCKKYNGGKQTQFAILETNVIPVSEPKVYEIDLKIAELAKKAKETGVKQFLRSEANPNQESSCLNINYYVNENGQVVR